MTKVLFLGAGFSKAFGLPVMCEFFKYAAKADDISREDKQFLERLRLQARNASSMVRGRHDDLEHILSLAIMSGTFGENEEEEYRRLQRIVAKVYGSVDMRTPIGSAESAFRQLLGLNRPGERPPPTTIITTNYDVLVELMCARCGYQPALPFAFHEAEGKGRWKMYAPTSSITLCKLHGSVNWELGADGVPIVNPFFHRRQVENPSDWERLIDVDAPAINASPLESPYIVPPSLVKDRPAPFLREVLSATRKAFADAERISFVGFSFPASDNYLTYLIAPALVDNAALDRIDVVGPTAVSIVEELKSGESRYGDHLKAFLNPVTGAWEDAVLGDYTFSE